MNDFWDDNTNIKFPKLYKKTQTGAIQEWEIIVDGNTFFTKEGQVNGKITESLPTICEPKNVGRANATTGQEQAEKEARSKWKKKQEEGYFTDISKVDEGASFFEPMLAKKYEDYRERIEFPLFTQPKLDGIRCIVKKDGMWSRNGKKIVSAPHIFEELKPLFDFNPDYIFDGELYADKFSDNFNKIVSMARKTKPTAEDLKESAEHLEYHIYDFPFWQGTFSERFNQLMKIILHITQKKIKLVQTEKAFKEQDLDNAYAIWLEQGYEGQMIRLNNALYENKRSEQLLKRKEFQDSEFKIVSVHEGLGNRSGMAGYAIMELGDGRTFRTNIKGTHEFCKQLLKDKDQVVGSIATVQFFQYTPDGMPRFPYIKEIRNYE